MPRLKRASDSTPGIRRKGRGRGFSYHEDDGTLIQDSETIERISILAIPPAWKDVWICPFPNGHIQATGIDAAGRKQYRYHDFWRSSRDREKHDEMMEFAKSLPKMREQVDSDLARRGYPRERVLACSVKLLDLGFFRVGSEQYTAENETYGLATLRRKHLKFKDGHAVFEYKAKGAKDHRQDLADPEVLKVLKTLHKREGGGIELLAYKVGGKWRDVKSSEINEYLKEVTGGDFSAKDFRTWNATVLAAAGLANREEDAKKSKTARRRAANDVVKDVARYLDNTPAVCRASYIDPRVFDRFESGVTIRAGLQRVLAGTDPNEFVERERIEAAVLRMLSD